MPPLEVLNHLLNFLAPALAVGVALALCGPFVTGQKFLATTLLRNSLRNVLIGAVLLGAGFWLFGHDGKMASYVAMVLGCALSQGLLAQR